MYRRSFYILFLAGVVGIAMLIGYRSDSTRGLLGCGLGGLVGILTAVVSHFLWKRVQVAQGHALVSAAMTAVIASFVLLIASVFAVYFLWPEVLQPVALTALAVYLVQRFVEAIQASRPGKGSTNSVVRGGAMSRPLEGLRGDES